VWDRVLAEEEGSFEVDGNQFVPFLLSCSDNGAVCLGVDDEYVHAGTVVENIDLTELRDRF
jgi:hypothetical protein